MGMATPSGLDVTTALAVAAEAATEAGRLLLELRRKPVEILAEPGHDIKLKADQLAEERILGRLQQRLPLPVLTEESGAHDGAGPDSRMWVVDPLDGTFNYSRGMPMCCTSIGLWDQGRPVLGVVHNFFLGQTFTGIVGQGAWLNGRPVAVSGVREAGKAALATGFPHQQDYSEALLREFIGQVQDLVGAAGHIPVAFEPLDHLVDGRGRELHRLGDVGAGQGQPGLWIGSWVV